MLLCAEEHNLFPLGGSGDTDNNGLKESFSSRLGLQQLVTDIGPLSMVDEKIFTWPVV